jgi:hypothetical protein
MLKEVISVLLYIFVGLISLFMASKGLLSKKYLPFHQEAAGKDWEQLDQRLQWVFLMLLRTTGLGFLVTGSLLVIFAVMGYFMPNPFSKYVVPGISFIYCFGLFLFSYDLYRKTKANTPWKKSLFAITILIAAFLFSL